MRFWMLVGAVTVLGAMTLGCGKKNVTWNCKCEAECDGKTNTVQEKGCGNPDEAQKEVDDAVKQCSDELNKSCQTGKCACECAPTEESCSK